MSQNKARLPLEDNDGVCLNLVLGEIGCRIPYMIWVNSIPNAFFRYFYKIFITYLRRLHRLSSTTEKISGHYSQLYHLQIALGQKVAFTIKMLEVIGFVLVLLCAVLCMFIFLILVS